MPLLRFFGRKTFFYCHFPDKLLCVERKSILKKTYRFFLDYNEEICAYFSNFTVVNSNFTRKTFKENFRILNKLGIDPEVLYPSLELSKFDKVYDDESSIEDNEDFKDFLDNF